MNPRPFIRFRPSLVAALLIVLGLLSPAVSLHGQVPDRGIAEGEGYPTLETRREILFSSAGLTLLAAGLVVQVDVLEVPATGLDPAAIRWGWDRGSVRIPSTGAKTASDWTRNAALVFPFLLSLGFAESGSREAAVVDQGLVYVEALLLSQGATLLGKSVIGRPRPFTYLPEDERPAGGAYDVTVARAFYSMPSGHASSAWTAAAVGMTQHLLTEPDAGWAERASVGAVGGGLAAATAALRVRAAQHFPSDVLVGTALGLAAGITMPLVHRGSASAPTTRAWLESISGLVLGSVVGVVLSR